MFSPERAYLLVGYPRTGSSVLCRALAGTGVLGVPQEYFWRMVEARHAEEMGVERPTDESYRDYLDAALRFGTTANGVFGSKLFWAHAQDLVRRTGLIEEFADLDPVQRLWAPFGRDLHCVFIQRNCLRAAVSLWRAERSGVWGLRPEDPDPRPPDRTDVWAVSVAHADMHAADIGWQTLLATAPQPLLSLRYEEVTADLAGSVQRVADFVGVSVPPEVLGVPPFYRRQADAWSERVIDQWWKVTGGCPLCEEDRPDPSPVFRTIRPPESIP